MDGSLFRWVTSIKLSIVFAIFLASYLIGMAFAQDDSQNQAAIEQALREALPKDEDLPGGIAWDPSNYRPEFLDISWTGHRISEECPDESRTRTDEDNFYVSGSITQSYYESAEAFCSKHISVSSHGVAPSPYGNLPGGVIWEVKHDQSFDFEISFWKSPNISGNLRFNVVLATGCGRPTPERQAESEAFVRSECERLARLMYDRLPGDGGSEYDQLIQILAEYWNQDPWKTTDKQILVKSLKQHETGGSLGPGPTYDLMNNMVPKVVAIEELANKEIDCNTILYDSKKSLEDVIRPLLPSITDIVDTPLDDLKKYVEFVHESSDYLRETELVPYEYENAYEEYKTNRDAYPTMPIREVMNAALSLRGKQDVEESSDLYARFEARYLCEKCQEDIRKIKENKNKIINKIILGYYEGKISKIEATIE